MNSWLRKLTLIGNIEWSGAGSITIYAPQFFRLLGTTGQSENFLATAIFGVVKFASAIICAFFLVDFIGRKRALSLGIMIQFVAMLYVAIFLTAVPSITSGKVPGGAAKHAATGAIVMIYFSGVGWALGWNSIQVSNTTHAACYFFLRWY
jgi:hypothetical protein